MEAQTQKRNKPHETFQELPFTEAFYAKVSN